MTKSLTKAEEQVMQTLWEIKQGFLKDILEMSPEPKPHSNTVATILKILVSKGFVRYVVQGRNNLYMPKISKEEVGKKTMNLLMKRYFENSPAKLVSQFLSDEKLSLKELEEMLQQIKSLKSGK